jgi:SdrD B-like domain/Dockerin type I domain
MRTKLFEQWRRAGIKQRTTKHSRPRARRLRVESLEERALLTATTAAGFTAPDVNHDGYVNVLDVVAIAKYINTHGMTAISGQSSASGTNTATPAAITSDSSIAMDVNGDGFVNVLDIVDEIQTINTLAPQAQYLLVPTDSSDTPLSGPVTVGTTFYIDVYVQDLRAVTYAGIAAGDVNVTYSAQGGGTAGAMPTGSITASPSYPIPMAAMHGDATSTPGVVLNVQGSEVLHASGVPFYYAAQGSNPVLLDRIQMTANTAGVVQFNTQFSLGEVTADADDTGNNDPAQIPNSEILAATATVTIVDAPPAYLVGSVYVDANGDNVQDHGETGLAGITVQLLNAASQVVDAKTTGSSGIFSFVNLAPGTYTLREIQPAGLMETGVTIGTVGGPTDGTANGFDMIENVTLASGEVGAGYSFALQLPASIAATEFVGLGNDDLNQ